MEITLKELLDYREERVLIQNRMRAEIPHPLICFTMNIAGPVKTSPLIERAFKWGVKELDEALCDYKISAKRVDFHKCGPTAYYSVNGNAKDIKDICVKLEESCPLGRLFDIDVIDTDGKKLERDNERGCIICNSPGRACAAGRLHSVEELQKKTEYIMTRHFADKDSEKLAMHVFVSLLAEVFTTPKPGLVDLENSGSHKDMTVETFGNSARALRGYFADCVKIGIDTTEKDGAEVFGILRSRGITAEKEMYEATGGVNTHKGIIYSMGIILCALGRLWKPHQPIADIEKIFDECSVLAKDSVRSDFEKIGGSTAGGRLYLLNGQRGIRGEASDGFMSVRKISLPAYEKALKTDRTDREKGVIPLLHLMANIYDTSVFNRGGEDGVLYVQSCAKKALESDDPIAYARKMDEDFIKRNLSPGGAADLLAITYFMYFIKNRFE